MVEKTNVVSIAKPDGFDLSKFRSKRAAAVQNRYWNVSELEAAEQRCAAPRAEGARQDQERRRETEDKVTLESVAQSGTEGGTSD